MKSHSSPAYTIAVYSAEGELVARTYIPIDYYVHIGSLSHEPLEHEKLTPRDVLIGFKLKDKHTSRAVLLDNTIDIGPGDSPGE